MAHLTQPALSPLSLERHEMKLPRPSVPPLPLEVYPNPNNSTTGGSRKVEKQNYFNTTGKEFKKSWENCRLFSPGCLTLHTDRLQRVSPTTRLKEINVVWMVGKKPVCVCVCAWSVCVHVYACMNLCAYVCVRACMHMRAHIYMYLCVYACMYICVWLHVCTYLCVCK